MATEGFAPAKINLALHVTGQRADGYHLLDSLVAFADFGDHVSVEAAEGLSLSVTGPFAGAVPAGADNLVLRAAALFGTDAGARITLDKHLPPASGIGGGSSDAAAALRVLARLWARPVPDALRLGADIPVCLAARAARMQGVGEVLTPVTLPVMQAVLVNPGVEVATPSVFRALQRKDNAPMGDVPGAGLVDWLATCRNDLEAPAIAVEPVIAEVLAQIRAQPGCLLARMSGSGATCFGIFDTAEQAKAAARAQRPDWWARAVQLS